MKKEFFGYLLLVSCARPQVVLIIDTDAPVVEQLATDPDLSADAAIDLLRVDVIGRDDRLLDACEFDRPSVRDWPLVLGVPTDLPQELSRPGPSVRLRLRAFARRFAQSAPLPQGSRQCGQVVTHGEALLTEPAAGVAIDRLVDLPLPRSGVVRRRVRLSFDCIGVPSRFDRGTTCLDGARTQIAPEMDMDMHIAEDDADHQRFTTEVGTTRTARTVPCRGEPPAGAVCVPGGFFFLGDLEHSQFGRAMLDAHPMRPVWLSPFYLDRTEFSVGRLRDLRSTTAPDLPEANNVGIANLRRYCTWDMRDPRMPVNCYSRQDAIRACRAAGGVLSSEARFEHAARGRGRRWRFPWGQGDPCCCSLSISRRAEGTMTTAGCPGEGPEPAGAHAVGACECPRDVSLDGVYDLAGSLSEYQLDRAAPLGDPCWTQPLGILRDPVCEEGSGFSLRGAEWTDGPVSGLSALRRLGSNSAKGEAGWGFRCAYPAHQ